MRIRTILGLAVAAAMAVVLAVPASAQAPSPAPQAPAVQAPAQPPAAQAAQPLRSPVEGEIVSVDTTTKKITIKPLTGADLVFTYNDKTDISGAHKDAAGLATMKEGRVTVHFTEDAATRMKTASRVIVEPKK